MHTGDDEQGDVGMFSYSQPLAQAWARYFTVCTKFVQTVNEEHRCVMVIRVVSLMVLVPVVMGHAAAVCWFFLVPVLVFSTFKSKTLLDGQHTGAVQHNKVAIRALRAVAPGKHRVQKIPRQSFTPHQSLFAVASPALRPYNVCPTGCRGSCQRRWQTVDHFGAVSLSHQPAVS